MSGKDETGLLLLDAWRSTWPGREWRKMLETGLEKEAIQTLRQFTARGWPLGSDGFLSKIESLLGRRLGALPQGRPVGWRKSK